MTGNDYWVSDFGLDLVHASRNHWFLTARLAWTVVRFAPDQQLMRDLGWQVAPLIPRAEVGIGLHF